MKLTKRIVMRKRLLYLLPLLMLTGCRNMSHTDRGVLAGGGLGAATGAIISSATGNSKAAGAVIGGALGAVAGGIAGDSLDESERRTDTRIAQAEARISTANTPPPRGPLSVQDIVQMTIHGVTDTTIINQIRSTGSRYQLSADDIVYLTNNGVSQRVIQEMQRTAVAAPRPVVVPQRVVYEPVPVYAPPRPRVGVGINYHFKSRRRYCH